MAEEALGNENYYRDPTPLGDTKNIDKLIDGIRHKTRGADVREAIARGIEVTFETASAEGNANMEVVKARGGARTLSERLDRYDISTAQVDNLIAVSGDGTIPSELADIRVGADEKIYQTAGQAVREQLKNIINQTNVEDIRIEGLIKLVDIQRKIEDGNLSDRIDIVELFETALALKDICIEGLVDNYDNQLFGKVWLPKTDKTLTQTDIPAEAKVVGEEFERLEKNVVGYTFIDHIEEYGLPILRINNSEVLDLQTKGDGKLTNVDFEYNSIGNRIGAFPIRYFGQLASIKVQGSSSQYYPKKNYTLVFNDAICLKKNWGNNTKYVIKANWSDPSYLRNEFGAKLWTEITKTRINEDYATLVDNEGNALVRTTKSTLSGEIRQKFNGIGLGSIDAYPVFVIVNGIYHGLYSMSVPKDAWLQSMGYSKREAILSANQARQTQFKDLEILSEDGALSGEGFEVEYVTNENRQSWLGTLVNDSIDLVKKVETGELPTDAWTSRIDKDSVIDYICHYIATYNYDGVYKNYLLSTWDGQKLSLSAYDMDQIFGTRWPVGTFYPYNTVDSTLSGSTLNGNNLFYVAIRDYKAEIVARWTELRAGILSNAVVEEKLTTMRSLIPQAALDYELLRWPARPATASNNFTQILHWIDKHLDFIDTTLN